MQHVFIVGAKSIGQYGGYETFVDKLTEYHQNNKKIRYHIACKANGQGYMDGNKLEKVTWMNGYEFVYFLTHILWHMPEDGMPAETQEMPCLQGIRESNLSTVLNGKQARALKRLLWKFQYP